MPTVEIPPRPTIEDIIVRAQDSLNYATQASLAVYSTAHGLNKILESRIVLNSQGRFVTLIEDEDDQILAARAILFEAEAAAHNAQRNLSEAILKLKNIKTN